MTVNSSIFKAYDIRGIYPDTIDEQAVEIIMKSIYTFFLSEGMPAGMTIALGHDMRVSSPSLFDVAKKTLAACGVHVIDLGLVATPTVYFAVKEYGYDAGIQISASHNPKEYNGIKMVRRGPGSSLIKIGKTTGMNSIKDIAMKGTFAPVTSHGSIEKKEDVLKLEMQRAHESIPCGDISTLKIVADPANAMGILPLQELFAQCGGSLIKMNFELDGTFPAHQADPLQHKTLRELQEKVKAEKADLGIATDGDGDRVMFIDEKGEIIPATLVTALIAREILMKTPGEKILVDIRYVRNVEEMVKRFGGTVSYTKVGHALITEQMNKENGVFAGESSGHYYFRSMGGCESSMRVVLHVLAALTREKKSISSLIAELRTSIESGEVNFKLADTSALPGLLTQLKSTYHDGTLNELDGIAIDYPLWRLSVRTSNTEPLLRLNVEGKTKEIVDEKMQVLTHMIVAAGAHVEE